MSAINSETQQLIVNVTHLSQRLRLLLSNDRQHVIKTSRDGLALCHWSLVFDLHEGLLLLLRSGLPAPAFALMRPVEEAFIRTFVVMHGTDKQAEEIWSGTYRTQFEVVWNQIYEKIGLGSSAGTWLKQKLSALHGFTHGGKEQLVRQAKGLDIVASYKDAEVQALLRETMTTVFLMVLLTTAFLGYPKEHRSAEEMLNENADWLSLKAAAASS